MEDRIIFPSFEIREKPYSESEWQQINANLERLARESLKESIKKEDAWFARAIVLAKKLG